MAERPPDGSCANLCHPKLCKLRVREIYRIKPLANFKDFEFDIPEYREEVRELCSDCTLFEPEELD